MTNLWEELQPLAVQVEEARSKIVEAARVYAHEQSAASGQAIIAAVKELEEGQMALGLKTSQLLLARVPIPPGGPATPQGFENFERPVEAEEGGGPASRPRAGASVGAAWGKKRDL